MLDVRLFRVSTGEEVVAELISEDEETITVKNCLVVYPQQNGVNFGPWITVCKKEAEVPVKKDFLVYFTEVDEEVNKKYNQMFGSKLEIPESKLII